MQSAGPDREALVQLLPESKLGSVQAIEPIPMGLSGAGVYAVTTSRGAYVLRVQEREQDPQAFAEQLRVLRHAADAGIAPAVVHVEEAARAVVSEKISGVPLPAVFADPAQRAQAITSVVEQLRALHALEPAGVVERAPVSSARRAWEAVRGRPGFPAWAQGVAEMLAMIGDTLKRDPRLVVSHNDVNPSNVLWDGARAWLVDWEVSGLNHPYYDLAVFAMFLRLEEEAALGLVARHDGAPLDEMSRRSFFALRKLACLLCGLTFLGLVDELEPYAVPTRSEVPPLGDVYAAIRTGKLELRNSNGKAAMGFALLAWGCEDPLEKA